MKKADIFFNGQIVITIEGSKFKLSDNGKMIIVYGEEEKVVAIVPCEYLVIFRV